MMITSRVWQKCCILIRFFIFLLVEIILPVLINILSVGNIFVWSYSQKRLLTDQLIKIKILFYFITKKLAWMSNLRLIRTEVNNLQPLILILAIYYFSLLSLDRNRLSLYLYLPHCLQVHLQYSILSCLTIFLSILFSSMFVQDCRNYSSSVSYLPFTYSNCPLSAQYI